MPARNEREIPMRRLIAIVLALAVILAFAPGAAGASARPNRSPRAMHVSSVHVARAGYGDSLLFYQPTVALRRHVNEVTIAESMGFDVTLATKAQWSAMSTADFESYDAIVFGDPACKSSTKRLGAARSNAAVWSAAIHGSIVVEGTDPVWHANSGTTPGPELLIADTLAYVAGKGDTGLAVSLSCYYAGAKPGTPVKLLSALGTFTVQGQGHRPLPGCPDRIETPNPSDPFLVGLTAGDLSNWGCSIHEAFDEYPYGYRVIAQHKKSDLPYIIAGHRA
jgi:hypothetical protein